MQRGARAVIDTRALKKNLKLALRLSGGLPVIAVVKADGYGHGALESARAFLKAGAKFLAVAFVSEARQLREKGIEAPILVLFDQDDTGEFFRLGLTPVISDLKTARRFSREAVKKLTPLGVHVKIDTGMTRAGLSVSEPAKKVLEIAGLKNIRVTGVLSHFSEAELSNTEYAIKQLNTFNSTYDAISQKGLRPMRHLSNSAAVMYLPDARMDAVRPGVMLYGVPPCAGRKTHRKLHPAMSVKSSVLMLKRVPAGTPVSYGRTFVTKRKSLLALMPAGYADGYSRSFSNRAEVLIKGKRAPIAGRVCMDLTVVDVTGIKGVREKDEITLLGTDGSETIDAWELADKGGTIAYEVLTSLGPRSRRQYV